MTEPDAIVVETPVDLGERPLEQQRAWALAGKLLEVAGRELGFETAMSIMLSRVIHETTEKFGAEATKKIIHGFANNIDALEKMRALHKARPASTARN